MVCKKCGFDGIEENGDWITCPNCGAKYFNTAVSPEKSATRQIYEMEESVAAKDGGAEEAQDKDESGGKKKKSRLSEAVSFLLPIVIAVIAALLLKQFVFANAIVPTGSMKNTIHEGDRIIASRIAYLRDDPERYDIILFYFPDDESQIFVKRVIGLPGETVTVANGQTFVTDKNGDMYKTDQSFITNGEPIGDYGPYYIPEAGEKITTDGIYCYAENGAVVGYAQFIDRYCVKDDAGNPAADENGCYTVEENLYFCMGDNRNESHDSRFWDNRYVRESKILGEASFKYYPEFKKFE